MLDMYSATTKYNFFDDGRGLRLAHSLAPQSPVSLSLLQGKPECDPEGVVECDPYSWPPATHWLFTILPPLPKLLLDTG